MCAWWSKSTGCTRHAPKSAQKRRSSGDNKWLMSGVERRHINVRRSAKNRYGGAIEVVGEDLEPAPRADWMSYGPRRTPAARGMDDWRDYTPLPTTIHRRLIVIRNSVRTELQVPHWTLGFVFGGQKRRPASAVPLLRLVRVVRTTPQGEVRDGEWADRGRAVAACFAFEIALSSSVSALSKIAAGSPSGIVCRRRSCARRSLSCVSRPTVNSIL